MKNYKVITGIFENTLFRGKEDHANKRIINIDSAGQSYPAENCKIVIKENLCNLSYTVNKTFTKEPILKANGERFVIVKPTVFKLSCINESKMLKITNIFKNLELVHNVTYYPIGYSKNNAPFYDVEIDLGYGRIDFKCDLLDFGYSYGEIEFEGEKFDLSHSGGTGGDFTDVWCVVGKPLEFAKLVETKFINARKN